MGVATGGGGEKQSRSNRLMREIQKPSRPRGTRTKKKWVSSSNIQRELWKGFCEGHLVGGAGKQ